MYETGMEGYYFCRVEMFFLKMEQRRRKNVEQYLKHAETPS